MPKATDLQSTASPLCYGRQNKERFRPDLNRHCYGRNVVFYRIKLQKQLPMGVEPTSYGLQNQCSTIKLGKLLEKSINRKTGGPVTKAKPFQPSQD